MSSTHLNGSMDVGFVQKSGSWPHTGPEISRESLIDCFENLSHVESVAEQDGSLLW